MPLSGSSTFRESERERERESERARERESERGREGERGVVPPPSPQPASGIMRSKLREGLIEKHVCL